MTDTVKAPTLAGWIVRDIALVALFAIILTACHAWQSATGNIIATIIGSVLGFVACYATCYIFHEWGHLIGARWANANMPLLPYKGVAIGYFDITAHDQRQFLYLSWGGVLGYLLITTMALVFYASGTLGLVGAGVAVGGLAFVVQSLAVDLPQIFKVAQGADIAQTSKEGANATIILRRTWQTWSLLAIALILWNLIV